MSVTSGVTMDTMTSTERWIRDEEAKLMISKAMYPYLWESHKIDESTLTWYPSWGLSKPDRSRMLKKINIREDKSNEYSTITVNPEYCGYEDLLKVYQFLEDSGAEKIKPELFLKSRI